MSSKQVITKCPAKVNLTFEILGLLPDGYHEVCTLLQTVSLEDELVFEFSETTRETSDEHRSNSVGRISYNSCESEFVNDFPTDDSNLISKAIRKYQEVVDQSKNFDVNVRIKKQIPIGAGLAGGSANAAAALIAMNCFFDEKLSAEMLLEIGASLGADVPFAIQGGTSIGTHRGDVLQALPIEPRLFFVLAKPRSLAISTPWAFKQFDKQNDTIAKPANTAGSTTVKPPTSQTTTLCAEALTDLAKVSQSSNGADFSPFTVAKHLRNDLEQIVFTEYRDLELVRQTMVEFGAIAARMTGSGPTLYALVESMDQAEKLKNQLEQFQTEKINSEIFPLDFWIAESISRGARVIKA
jgi:4-diphosphocytidyl-2-C-methyl-D-erythritol kinase